jgi:antitoxin FitA
VGQVVIRNIDDGVLRRLRTKAELKGCSLEQELRRVLGQASKLSPEERYAVAKRISGMTPKGAPQSDSAQLIREWRDRGR